MDCFTQREIIDYANFPAISRRVRQLKTTEGGASISNAVYCVESASINYRGSIRGPLLLLRRYGGGGWREVCRNGTCTMTGKGD